MAGSGLMATIRLDWTREEVILAMDLYVTAGAMTGGSMPGKTSPQVAALSALLKQLNAYPVDQQGDRYRNPDGVYLKLTNLRAIETDGQHGMKAYSQLDAAVWRDYQDDLTALHAEAEAIRKRLSEGVIKEPQQTPTAEDVDIEQQHTERFLITPNGDPRPAERAKQKLVLRYRDHMANRGIVVRRKRYRPTGEGRPAYSDAWVEDRNVLIEAKNTDSRDALRQAIGQLYDYKRFHAPAPDLAVLLPYAPTAERLDLLRSAGIEAIWPFGTGFRDSVTGRFV